MSTPSARVRIAILAVVALFIVAGIAYRNATSIPAPGQPKYQEMVSAFYRGVIALEAGDTTTDAPDNLKKATQLVPQEPAAWADLGCYQMRVNQTADAAKSLQTAASLAPNNGKIEALLGNLAASQGDFAGAIADFKKAAMLDPNNLKVRFSLEQAIQQQAGSDADSQSIEQLRAIFQIAPSNLQGDIELAKMAAKTGDKGLVDQIVSLLASRAGSWTPDCRDQYNKVKASAAGTDLRTTGIALTALSNVLEGTPEYQSDHGALQNGPDSPGDPIDRFLVLPNPPSTPAPPDLKLSFAATSVSGGFGSIVRYVWLGQSADDIAKDTVPALVCADSKHLAITAANRRTSTLGFPGGSQSGAPGPSSVLPVDFNNDLLTDFVCAGQGGLKFYQQIPGSAPTFSDVTSKTKLRSNALTGAYSGAWQAALYTGGALDIVLGTKSGQPTALRNNDDGTFTVVHPFTSAADGLTDFAWADLDGDGVDDASFIDAGGTLNVYHNQRSGSFEPWAPPDGLGQCAAVSAADIDRSGTFSVVVWSLDGRIRAAKRRPQDETADPNAWTITDLTTAQAPPTDGTARLAWADLDNNGALDLIATSSAGTQVFLADTTGKLVPISAEPDVRDAFVYDDGASGRLGLSGTSSAGAAQQLANHGSMNYNWQQVRLHAVSKGDGRNNSYGIGADITLRAGLLYEHTMIRQPVTHLGLGTYPRADALRIVWPNGVPQAELTVPPNGMFDAPERLVGSCPWLFAWNGNKMDFVTDFLWRSAVGLRINAQNTVGSMMTGDWNKIEGDQLAPRDGTYDFRLTTQLWETYFFDMIKLKVVDHPANTQMWVDERFSIPPPKLAYHITTPAHSIVKAVDDLGNDVTVLVSARDGRYVDSFGVGRYQGVTRDHWIQLDLAPEPSVAAASDRSAHEYLLCNGWIHPTDSSINMALSFGTHPHPTSLSLEVPDGCGGWRTAASNLGFPEGKNKSILIDITGLFKPGQSRVVRLRTNLEIYWDWISTVADLPTSLAREVTIDPSVANLQYHGFNHFVQAKFSSPETPIYDLIDADGQQWRDMTGYYTRYGDVRELLKTVDDRYVIQNAGDEIDLRFAAPPAPPAGWTRDYILIGDGWGKDCNISSGYSKTVIPLPSHADTSYSRPPTTLADEPVYRAHKADWSTYQTRYVTTSEFNTALAPK